MNDFVYYVYKYMYICQLLQSQGCHDILIYILTKILLKVSFCKLLHDNYNTCRVLQYIYTENTTMGTCSVLGLITLSIVILT